MKWFVLAVIALITQTASASGIFDGCMDAIEKKVIVCEVIECKVRSACPNLFLVATEVNGDKCAVSLFNSHKKTYIMGYDEIYENWASYDKDLDFVIGNNCQGPSQNESCLRFRNPANGRITQTALLNCRNTTRIPKFEN